MQGLVMIGVGEGVEYMPRDLQGRGDEGELRVHGEGLGLYANSQRLRHSRRAVRAGLHQQRQCQQGHAVFQAISHRKSSDLPLGARAIAST